MKKLRYILFVCTLSLSFLNYAQEPSQMQKVIKAHDEVMAKMPHLIKLVNQLLPKVDSTKSGKTHQKAVDALKASNEFMIAWMQGFGERFTADEMMKEKELCIEKKVWLSEENQKIEALRKEINSSIKKAEKLLKK